MAVTPTSLSTTITAGSSGQVANTNTVHGAVNGLTAAYPTSAEKVLFVTPRGSDSADGLTLKTAKLTLAAALTTMGAGALGRIELGVGVIDVGSGLSLSGYACEIVGQGDATIIATVPPATPSSSWASG